MSQLLYETHAIEKRYYRLIRVFLKLNSLWPYQQSFFSRIHKMLFIIIMVTCIISQVLNYIYNFCAIVLNNYNSLTLILHNENNLVILLLLSFLFIYFYLFFYYIMWQY